MMLMTEAPADLFDEFALGPQTTLDGELLGQLNDSPPGAWLAVLVESLDVESLTGEDLIELLRATGRLIAWVTAIQVRAVARLVTLCGVSAAVEVGFALREPVGAAARRVHYATQLCRRLPATLTALAHGRLFAAHAEKLVDAVCDVEDAGVVREVERRVLDRAADKTANEVGRHARDLVRRLDPHGGSGATGRPATRPTSPCIRGRTG